MFGLFKKKPKPPAVSPVVDLDRFSLDDLHIGQQVPAASPYREFFAPCSEQPNHTDYKNPDSGVTISTKNGRIDCFFLNLTKFTGRLLRNGEPLQLRQDSTEAEVSDELGEPYWKNIEPPLEVIDFHEFDEGRVEIQFEYPDMCQLSFITILSPGVLADPEQRRSYKVTKPWPPNEIS